LVSVSHTLRRFSKLVGSIPTDSPLLKIAGWWY
jgi:hypothetical protein